jgi:protease I
MVPFVRALLPFFAGLAPTPQPAAAGAVSSPQRNAPPQAVLEAMKWLPRPSLRALALAGAVAAVFVARNHHKQGLRRMAG